MPDVDLDESLEGATGLGELGEKDKRLKTALELLNAGSYKKLIAEADKLVRRHPNLVAAKVLKGLALIRMGRVDDAREILIPVIEEVPTDEAAIDLLSICCHELDDPVALCKILEAASNKEPSEYLLSMFFYSQVQVIEIEDYQKQHLTALNLYKLYKKPKHFVWAIASLIAKFERQLLSHSVTGGKVDLDMIPVQLVERMCDKFIEESTCPEIEDSILFCYLIALRRLEKWEKMLQVMKDHNYPKEPWSMPHFHELYSMSLAKANKLDERFEYLKSKFTADPDDFDALHAIVTTSCESQKDAILAFLNDLRESRPSRLVAVADLIFCREHPQEDGSKRVEEDFEMAIGFGGDKMSLYFDLVDSFQLLSDSAAPAIVKLLAPIYSDTEDKYYDSVSKVIKDVNFEIFGRDILLTTTAFDRLNRADRCFGKYLACEKAMKALATGDNIETAEPEPYDQLVIIAATSLIAVYYQYPDLPDQIVLVEEMLTNKEWVCNDNDPKELNQIRSELSPFELTDLSELSLDDQLVGGKDMLFVFITAILLLEHSFKRVPCNGPINILLAKSYSCFGASLQALRVIDRLALKHIQWDNLGYLMMFEALNAGLYTDAMSLFTEAENMYLSCVRQGMDNAILAYKCGNVEKITECLGFSDQLFDSIQCSMVFCEKRMLSYVINNRTSAELRMVAKSILPELDERLVSRIILYDNRDFSVLQGLAEDIDLEYLKEISCEAETNFFNIRISLLFCLTKLLIYLENMEDEKEQERTEIIAYIDRFEKYVTSWDTAYASYRVVNIQTPIAHGIWPPQCQKYKEVGAFNVLRDLLLYVKDLLQSDSNQIDKRDMEELSGIIMTGSLFLLSNLSSRNVTDDYSTLKGLAIDTRITKVHFILETFSFMRIIIECIIEIENRRLHIWKMDRRNKGRLTAMVRQKKSHQESIGILLDGTIKMVKYIDEFRDQMQNYSRNIGFVRKFDMLRTSEILLKPGFIFQPFSEHFDPFFENIEASFLTQAANLRKFAQILVDYIKQLEP